MADIPGPWITDPPATYVLSLRWWGDGHSDIPWGQWRGIGMNFVTICDSGSPGGLSQIMTMATVAGNVGETDYDGNPIAVGDFKGYQQESMRLSFPIDAFDALPNINGFSLPPNATDFQVEGYAQSELVNGDLSWITSDIDIVGDHWTVNNYPEAIQGGYDTGHPLSGIVQYRANPTPHDVSVSWSSLSTFETSANLAAFELLGSDTFTGSTVEYAPEFVAPRSLLPTSGASGQIEIIIDAKAVVDQTAPTYGPLNGDNPGYDESSYFIVRPGIITGFSWPPTTGDPPACTYSLTFTYQRPRYRYFYPATPPLRLANRDDEHSRKGSTPRIKANNHSTSGQVNPAGRITQTNTYW